MPDKGWKQFERRVAKLFGTKRNPLSGENGGHSGSDTLHPEFFIECKSRKKSAIHSLLQETRLSAVKEHKLPVLALQKANAEGFIVAVHSSDLQTFCELFLEQGLNEG